MKIRKISKTDCREVSKFSLYYTMCTVTPSTQVEQSPAVFYLLVHPTQLADDLAACVSGTPRVDPEHWEPILVLPEIVPLLGIFTGPSGAQLSVAVAET